MISSSSEIYLLQPLQTLHLFGLPQLILLTLLCQRDHWLELMLQLLQPLHLLPICLPHVPRPPFTLPASTIQVLTFLVAHLIVVARLD